VLCRLRKSRAGSELRVVEPIRYRRPLRRWPREGVYFFFDQGEVRRDDSDRVVRVATHALTANGRAILLGWLR
jgi:hypothetical protein